MFKTRLLSGIVLVALALLLIIKGGEILLFSLGIISLIGLYELYRVFQIHKKSLGVIGYVAVLLYYVNLYEDMFMGTYTSIFESILLLIVPAMMLLLAIYVFSFPKYHINQVMGALFGFFYVGVLISCVSLTRELPCGDYLVWIIFLSSWGCDTCAYCAGKLFGKHKMTPVLSPHKTWEGAIGGIIGSGILTVVYGLILKQFVTIETSMLWGMVIISAIAAVISMIGDLAASAIKRNYEIKDYGKLIPGHGGILDRFDSVIFTAPIVFYMCTYLVR